MWSDLIQVLISPLSKVATKCWNAFRIWRFKRSSKQAPLDEKTARDIVFSTFPGSIESVYSYRNIDSDRIHLAALFDPSDGGLSRVIVLEQTGGSYRLIWNSIDHLKDVVRRLDVLDLDNDGFVEIVVEGGSGGTGAFSKFICIYSHKYRQHYEISELVNFQEFAGPLTPEVALEPIPPEPLRIALEAFAMKRGFLGEPPQIDWDSPKYAIKRWHRDNGASPSGRIEIVFYESTPPPNFDVKKFAEDVRAGKTPEIVQQVTDDRLPFSSSISESLDDGKILWISFFKNPLVGLIKGDRKWFIAYSPTNFYNGARSLTFDGRRLWFATNNSSGIFSFDYERRELIKHNVLKGIPVEAPDRLRFEKGRLKVGPRISLTKEELDDACLGRKATNA